MACTLLHLNCRLGHVTSTIALKCQLPCVLKLAMRLIICMLQDSSAHFPHLKSVNLSMLNSTVKRDVYQLRGLYHVGNEACSVLIKHVLAFSSQSRCVFCVLNTSRGRDHALNIPGCIGFIPGH